MKNSVYSELFDTVTDELEKNNISFKFSKESFMYTAKCSPDNINVLDLLKFDDNKVFLETAYIAFLQRPIDDKAFANWKERFSLPADEFRTAVITTLTSSQEFANTMISIQNDIYSTGNILENAAPAAASGVKWPEKLLRFYRKQPEFIKKALRKSMGMKG